MIIFLCLTLFTYDIFIEVIISLGQECPIFFAKGHSRYCWLVRGGTRVKTTLSGVPKGIIYCVQFIACIYIYIYIHIYMYNLKI